MERTQLYFKTVLYMPCTTRTRPTPSQAGVSIIR